MTQFTYVTNFCVIYVNWQYQVIDVHWWKLLFYATIRGKIINSSSMWIAIVTSSGHKISWFFYAAAGECSVVELVLHQIGNFRSLSEVNITIRCFWEIGLNSCIVWYIDHWLAVASLSIRRETTPSFSTSNSNSATPRWLFAEGDAHALFGH